MAGNQSGICRISFLKETSRNWFSWFQKYYGKDPLEGSSPLIKQAAQQLTEYFQRERRQFQIPLDLRGTSFQKRIWTELLSIPYGTTISYGEVARRIGRPRASRAVGSAVGNNPMLIIVPCHRIIAHDGSLAGFRGGFLNKRKLLKLEQE